SEHCRLLKQYFKVDLYPGVAVVKSEYTLVTDSSFTGWFKLLDSPTVSKSAIGDIHPLSSHKLSFYAGEIKYLEIPVKKTDEGYEIMYPFTKKDTSQITSIQLIQTNQALMANGGSTKENNALGLVFNNRGWQGQGVRKAFIQLKEKLNLINIYGLSPKNMILGDLTHLEYSYDIARDSVMVIWFEGAAADFKFDKKVMPFQEALFDEINKFDVRRFKNQNFGVLEKNDFSTDKKNQLLSILYFVMFSVPWVILVVFILFLIFRKKKKTNIES
ncbi:MAG: hypothetical protein ACO29O_07600, partial [Chitinophagaceae bacterium]